MLGVEKFRSIADEILSRSAADQTEVLVIGGDSALTRFANSTIHQNVVARDLEVRVRAVVGQRVGVAVSNDLSSDSLTHLAKRAEQVARRQPDDPDFPGLPRPSAIASVKAFRSETAECSPQRRARMVAAVCDVATERGLLASGALTTESTEVGVANSHGLFAHDASTRANLLAVVMEDDGSGYAERTSPSVEAIDAEGVGIEAVDKAVRSRGAVSLEPGDYPVVLEEYATGDLLSYLAYMGFGALAYQEGHSFLRGKLDQRIVDERLSVWDDGHDPRGLPSAFDFEGVPKQRVDLIEQGVARGVVHDSKTAAREGRDSTGHALPAPNTFGPFPSHLAMAPGDTPKEDLAQGIERGLWVTRFHYVNPLQSDRAVLTGMTRDGTFLIERGEVTRPVKNLRFTQSVTDAWSDVRAVGREIKLIDGWGGGLLVPAMSLNSFSFTGVSLE